MKIINSIMLILSILLTSTVIVVALQPPQHSDRKLVVTGNVYDSNTGEWQVGKLVTVTCPGFATRTTRTDSDGAFSVVINKHECGNAGQEVWIDTMGSRTTTTAFGVPEHQRLYVAEVLIERQENNAVLLT